MEIWYEEGGAGRPLVLVHGFPVDHTMWTGQLDGLSSRCRVIAPDLPGFGRTTSKGVGSLYSDRPRGDAAVKTPDPFTVTVTMAQFADDLAALLDGLNIREPVVLGGLSMGGYIAFQFWRKHAARLAGLILCDTRASADSPEAAAGRLAMADRVLRKGPAPVVDAMLPKLLAESTRQQKPEVVEGLRTVMAAGNPLGIAAAARGMAERPDMTSALAEIACPTLVIVGQDDIITPPAEMRVLAQAIPAAKFVEIPAAGHMSPLENPAAVNAAMAEFISNL
jgi:pimeloyl-ACP methyl ester carboxylesterase